MLFKFRGNRQSSHITIVEDDCWSKDTCAQYAATTEDEDYLFMTYLDPQNVDETLKSQVTLGDDKQVQVEGNGTVVVTLQGRERFIPDVHYAPEAFGFFKKFKALAENQSYRKLKVLRTDRGGEFLSKEFSGFSNEHGIKRELIAPYTPEHNGIAERKNRTIVEMARCTLKAKNLDDAKEESTDVWHQRYGHLYVKGLQLLVNKEMVKGLPIIKKREHKCEGCPLGKQARKSFPVAQAKRAEEKLELVHADICGPMKTDSYAGSKYFLFFIDDYSRMCWFYFLTHKSEAFGFFKKFKALSENQSHRKLKVLRTDKGGEFLSKEFSGFSNEHGIKRELIAPYTPEHNGIAERKNRTIVEMARFNTRGDTSQSIITQSSSSSSGSLEEDTESEGLQLRRSKRGNVPKRHIEVEGKSFDFAMYAGDPANAESTTTTTVPNPA
nr:retrovirus-related Pol polyprotein from transposon TNT 1-94 [Tanacetum cinerariifolium]